MKLTPEQQDERKILRGRILKQIERSQTNKGYPPKMAHISRRFDSRIRKFGLTTTDFMEEMEEDGLVVLELLTRWGALVAFTLEFYTEINKIGVGNLSSYLQQCEAHYEKPKGLSDEVD